MLLTPSLPPNPASGRLRGGSVLVSFRGQFTDRLTAISGEQLWSRFDPKKFADAEIYPDGWAADEKDYVVGYYEELRSFFAEAAQAGDAMILYLN